MKDEICGHHLKTFYLYIRKKRESIGKMCVICDDGLRNPTKSYVKLQRVEKKKLEFRKTPKHGQKKRFLCPNPRCKSANWKLRKIPKKQGQTQHWKGTCKKCGHVWFQNTPRQNYIINRDQPKLSKKGL